MNLRFILQIADNPISEDPQTATTSMDGLLGQKTVLAHAEQGSTASMSPNTNPFASSLSRDALLAYAYHLYHTFQHSQDGLTAIPLVNTLAFLASPEQTYRLRLLPLLATLRSLHPKDLPVLLLLACTYHALGDYTSSISISQEMLSIDPDCVNQSHNSVIGGH